MVAHRLRSTAHACRSLVMRHGRIVEVGRGKGDDGGPGGGGFFFKKMWRRLQHERVADEGAEVEVA